MRRRSVGCAGEEGAVVAELTPVETRARDAAFVRQCSLSGLQEQLPLCWPTSSGTPPSPKRHYRSHYVYQGFADLEDWTNWQHLSDFDLVLRLVDFSGLRPVLAQLLGWTSARGRTPFDPVSMFLLVSWQLINKWKRSVALSNLSDPRYADYRQRFGFQVDSLPTEGGVRYFLTTIGHNAVAEDDTVAVELDHGRVDTIVVQYLNQLLAASVALIREAGLVSPEAWEKALVCPDGMIHDAASQMRCAFVQASCYQPISAGESRSCPAREKDKRGCDCDTLACALSCRHAPVRDPEARCVVYAGSNGSHSGIDVATAEEGKGELRYGYRSLALQFAEPLRRFSLVLLDDFLPASAREENPSAALLLQLNRFYPDLQLGVVTGDAGLGYYSFLHAVYRRGAKRVVDLRADPGDKLKAQWPIRGYNDKGRPVCPFGYALTSNGCDTDRQRHKWFCAQTCRNGTAPLVELDHVIYPPQECAYQDPERPHGQIINVGETFKSGSIRLVRDIPVGTPTWKRLYHRARNASEYRNSVLENWSLKHLPVFGQPRGRALTALADVWLNLTTLARLVREATAAAHTQPS
jgi:hypothetical protein